eukprot:IDg2232t1
MKSQQRYKKNYDKNLRIRRKHFEVEGYAFLRVEKNSKRKSTRRHKLAPIADGLFRVTTVKERTIVFERPEKTREEVSIDRAEPAPQPKNDHNAPIPQPQYSNKRNPKWYEARLQEINKRYFNRQTAPQWGTAHQTHRLPDWRSGQYDDPSSAQGGESQPRSWPVRSHQDQ